MNIFNPLPTMNYSLKVIAPPELKLLRAPIPTRHTVLCQQFNPKHIFSFKVCISSRFHSQENVSATICSYRSNLNRSLQTM